MNTRRAFEGHVPSLEAGIRIHPESPKKVYDKNAREADLRVGERVMV